MPLRQLSNYLDTHNIHYQTRNHTPAFTAQEVAQSCHLSGHHLAKTVIAKVDDEMVMVVTPATEKVNFTELLSESHAHTAELASEDEFSEKFPMCDLGAMPPFGNLFGMKVFVSEELTESDVIAFNSGFSTEIVTMDFADYDRLVKPSVIRHRTP